jgi:hypothetical protein
MLGVSVVAHADARQAPELDGPAWGLRALHDSSRRLDGTPARGDVQALLRRLVASPLLEVRSTAAPAAPLRGLVARSRQTFRYYHRTVPVCGYSVRASALADGRHIAFGRAPALPADAVAPSMEWPDEARAAASVSRAWALTNGAAGEWRKTAAEKCYAVLDGALLPAWRMRFTIDGLPYHAVADDQRVHAIERGYFAADGFARVHALNDVLTPELSDVELKDLDGDGTLKDAKLRIVVPPGYQKATSAEHAFVYDPDDARFAQASAFAHGQQHRLWFESLGVEWRGSLPLEVKLHVKPGGRANNALYVPDDENTAATISIDDGDGVELQKLALDSDVLSHELGHHVVFETLKKTDGEALVLHEGLADFFLFARADDPCLGESICPEGSKACIVEAQCLRSGALDLRFGDDDWKSWAGSLNRLGHLHSQVISGMLWDVRREDLMSVTDLAKLVLRAVSLLNEDSGFADFLAALVAADEELHAGQHVAKLQGAAVARGLESFLTGGAIAPGVGTDTDSTPPATGGSTPAAGATTSTATETATATSTSTATAAKSGSSDKDKRLPFCGVAGDADGQHSAAILLVMLAVLAPALWPARRSSQVRAWLSAPERRWRSRSTRRRRPL